MRYSIYILLFGFLISLTSCRKDFDTIASSGNLEFSKTEVYLDTVFTNIGSSTYSLKVYNRSNDDIKIPTIQLGKGLNSKYRIMVDGMTGNNKIFNDVELLANDSLYIFIETTANIADANPVNFTYNDQILFDNGGNQQAVNLITLIQDAQFIFPNRSLDKKIYENFDQYSFNPGTRGHALTTNAELNWNNTKPYVIYGNCLVPSGSTLKIAAGTSVHFHKDATLIIDDGATLNIQGGLNILDGNGKIIIKNEVTFEGDRLEPEYEDVPGQWGAIILSSGANNNIEHLTLKNALVGLLMQRNISTTTPRLTIKNSQFYSCAIYGILARASIIDGKNLVINDAGQATLACQQGGLYDFTHCTFNNNWSNSTQLAVLLDNFISDQNGDAIETINLDANFKNSIIYGSNNIELLLVKKTVASTPSAWRTNFEKCLVKFNDTNNRFSEPEYAQIKGLDNYINQNPSFLNVRANQLNINNSSFAKGKANFANSGFADILGKNRNNPSDIGAYNALP